MHYGWDGVLGWHNPHYTFKWDTNTLHARKQAAFFCVCVCYTRTLICLLSKSPRNQKPNLFVYAFQKKKEPELSWWGGQKTDAQLWGTGWLTTLCHQSLCKHLWLRQQGTTHTHKTHTCLARRKTCYHMIRSSGEKILLNPVRLIVLPFVYVTFKESSSSCLMYFII